MAYVIYSGMSQHTKAEEIRVREGQRKPNLMGLLSIVES